MKLRIEMWLCHSHEADKKGPAMEVDKPLYTPWQDWLDKVMATLLRMLYKSRCMSYRKEVAEDTF
jgi:hypothetical protein